jgi:hypothetical protein
MTVSEADLNGLVGRSQLAGALGVSTKYVADLTRRGILKPLKEANGTAVCGRYLLVASRQAFCRYIRTEKGKE